MKLEATLILYSLCQNEFYFLENIIPFIAYNLKCAYTHIYNLLCE